MKKHSKQYVYLFRLPNGECAVTPPCLTTALLMRTAYLMAAQLFPDDEGAAEKAKIKSTINNIREAEEEDRRNRLWAGKEEAKWKKEVAAHQKREAAEEAKQQQRLEQEVAVIMKSNIKKEKHK